MVGLINFTFDQLISIRIIYIDVCRKVTMNQNVKRIIIENLDKINTLSHNTITRLENGDLEIALDRLEQIEMNLNIIRHNMRYIEND